MDIAMKCEDLLRDLRKGRTNLTIKGVEVSNTAGFSEVMDKILEIPSGATSVGTVVDDSISVFKQVPINSTKYCYLSKLGGYTHVVPDDSTILAPIRLENAKPTAIRVHGANLIPYPYSVTTQTANGITFTDNGDGTITVNGTATAQTQFLMIRSADRRTLPAGTYTVSGCPIGGSETTYCLQTAKGKEIGNGLTFTLTEETFFFINITIYAGTVCNNLVFKPMLNAGSTAIPYTNYKAPVEITLPESITSLTNLGLGLYDNEYNECDLVNQKYIQRCNTKTFVGTESFAKSTVITRSRFTIATPVNCRYWRGASGSLSNQKCDYFEVDATIDQLNGNDTLKNKMSQWGQNWYWYVSGEDFPDLETWKAYLAEHNMEVVYELEMENTTDLNIGDFNPLIEVEGGGSIEFITDSGYAPNSTVIFQTIV